jgi:hypothetical protein
MAHGVVSEDGLHHIVAVPAASVGEDRTDSFQVGKLPTQDVSIHAMLGTWERYEYDKLDNATVGIMSWVEGGLNQDLTNSPALWPTYLRRNNISSFVVGFRIAANGGYMKGHYFVQFWGDPSEYEGRENGISDRSAHVVYDADTGRVCHVHHRIELTGADTDDVVIEPLELARALSHTGNLAILDVAPEDLIAGPSKVDLDSQRMVPYEGS